MYAECNRVRTNKKFLRFDFKQGTRPGIANRVVLSEVNEKDLALDLNYILPKSVTVSEDQLSLSEIYIGGHKGPDFLLFEGARANNHGILSPDNDVVGDIAYMVNKSKGDLYTMHIQYTDISGVVHPSITSGSYFVHMIKLLLNSKGNVKITKVRTSILPGIAKSFCTSGNHYMTKRTFVDYKNFLDYLAETNEKNYVDKNK